MKMLTWWFRMPPPTRAHWFNMIAGPAMVILFTFITRSLWILLPLATFAGAAIHNSLFAFWLDRDLKQILAADRSQEDGKR